MYQAFRLMTQYLLVPGLGRAMAQEYKWRNLTESGIICVELAMIGVHLRPNNASTDDHAIAEFIFSTHSMWRRTNELGLK